MKANSNRNIPVTLDVETNSLLPIHAWPVSLADIIPHMRAFYKIYLKQTVAVPDSDIRDVLLLGRRPNQTLALIQLALLTDSALIKGQQLVGPEMVDYFSGRTDKLPKTLPSLGQNTKPPRFLGLRRLARTASWTSIPKIPKAMLYPDAVSLTHNSLLRELLHGISDSVRNSYDCDFINMTKKRDMVFLKKIDVAEISSEITANLLYDLPLQTEIKVRLSKAIRQLFNESYQDATNILAHLRAVPKLPNKIYTGTGNKWMSRALGLEIIRREGEAIRCDHGGSISLLHPPEFVALNELAVSSKFYVTTKMAAELPELNDAVKLTNPIQSCLIKSANGDPGLEVTHSASHKKINSSQKLRVMYIPSLFYGLNQASPPVLGGPQYMAWQERLIGILNNMSIDLTCRPHPGGQKPPHNLNPTRDIALAKKPFESVVANTDVLIYDFPATTTLAVGLCTDRAIILLDHGTMKFNESVSSEIRKRCTLLTCNFDEHNIPFISKDALESAICDSTRISDPTYFKQLFLGKLK